MVDSVVCSLMEQSLKSMKDLTKENMELLMCVIQAQALHNILFSCYSAKVLA